MTVDWIRSPSNGRAKLAAASPRRLVARLQPSPTFSTVIAGCAPMRSRLCPNISASSRRASLAEGRLRPPSAPLVGYVGAGAVAHFYADGQGPFDDVDAPLNSKPTTVAVQVRGHSLGVLFDNWLVFYDDIRNPPDDSLVGRMCVCGLSDGRVLIKSVKRSAQTGLWNLLSNTEPPIYDAGLDWAAPVREMRPR